MSEVEKNAESPTKVKTVSLQEDPKVFQQEELKVQVKQDFDDDDEENWYELRVEGKQPERRANHSSFVHGSKMFIYGGYDMREGPMSSVWSFDFKNVGDLANADLENNPALTWQQVQSQGVKKPGALSNHTSVMWNNKSYLFGGTSGLSTSAQFFCFDPATSLWTPVQWKPKGGSHDNNPPEVDDHTAVVHGDHMYVFGGFVDGDRTHQVYKFNFVTAEWQLVKTDAKPQPRASHTAVVVPDEGAMYIFGGKDNEDQLLNDMWKFDFAEENWSQVAYAPESQVPRGRTGASSALYNNHIVMFGGIYEITRELNDLHLFSLKTKTWHRLFKASNEDPFANSPSKADTIKSKKTRTGGDSPETAGTSKLNTMLTRQQTKKQESKKPKAIKEVQPVEEPIKLESPTSVTMKQSFLLKQSDKEFEGYWNVVKKKKDGQPACAQAFGLFPPINQIGGARQSGTKPSARDGHSSELYGDYFFVFGGDRHQMPFNDLFVLDLKAEFARLGL